MTQAPTVVFACAPDVLREAALGIAVQWRSQDLLVVTAPVERGALSLDGLITHTPDRGRAHAACGVTSSEPQCMTRVSE